MMVDKNKHVCPVERAGGLDNKVRRLLQNPQRILGNYVKEGMTALDLGCGPGFFSVEMAKMVGESGMVIAVDLQEGMLQKLKDKIQGTEIEKRIKLYKCEEDTIGVSENVDFVLAFYMVHEVPDQKKFFEEIKSILKPDGKALIVEPKLFHVSKRAFKESMMKAREIGLEPVEKPRLFLSRAVILEKR
jgi:ubiquinone/menaquinone biosynthesis C-methylase UbiE